MLTVVVFKIKSTQNAIFFVLNPIYPFLREIETIGQYTISVLKITSSIDSKMFYIYPLAYAICMCRIQGVFQSTVHPQPDAIPPGE